MGEHTKRPLYVVWNGHYFDVIVGPHDYSQSVASVHTNAALGINKDVAETHARLFAAASGLLEALTNLADAVEPLVATPAIVGPVTQRVREALKGARETVARADVHQEAG